MNKIKYFSKPYWHRKYVSFLEKTHSDQLEWEQVKELYYSVMGKWLDYDDPKDLNEKLMWLTRYWRHPLKTECADKYLVRNYVKSVGLDSLSVPLIGVWENADDIDFQFLPNEFVLKCNHGSGFNIICTDKKSLDIADAKKKLCSWLSIDYSSLLHEIHYKDIPRKIVCEQFVGDSIIAPTEYQFWCLNGEPESILVCRKNLDNTYDAASYSLGWKQLFDRLGEKENNNLAQPECGIELLVKYAKTLSAPFPFVRVDFYVVNDLVYLAELTFTPSANLLTKYKQSFLDRLGSKLQLPNKLGC